MARKYWTLDKCLESAGQYQSIGSWIKGDSRAYYATWRNGWLEQCTQNMRQRRPNGYYTKELCLMDAFQYSNVRKWMEQSPATFVSAYRNGWYKECTAHMANKQKWTLHACLKEAQKYPNLKAWRVTDYNSYGAAHKYGWIEECTQHMKGRKRKGYWKGTMPGRCPRVPDDDRMGTKKSWSCQ